MKKSTQRIASLFMSLLIVFPLLVPIEAFAKAGNSRSFGSMGSRSFNNNGGQTLQRSTTPRFTPTPSNNAAPRFNQAPNGAPMGNSFAGGGGNFFQRNPLLSGVLGGVAGYGLGSLLFGGLGNRGSAVAGAPAASGSAGGEVGAPVAQLSPFEKFMGILFNLLVIAGIGYLIYRVVRWVMRRNSQQQLAVASPYNNQPYSNQNQYDASPAYGNNQGGGYNQGGGGPWDMNQGAPPVTRDIRVGEGDESAFGGLLLSIQKAWSDGNTNQLRMMTTPEMLDYFTDELSSNTSRGIINKVEDVKMISGQVESAWEEDGRDYATARIRFSARDYNVRMTPEGREELVSGKPDRAVTTEELWTFVRSSGGGNWILSAIQQV